MTDTASIQNLINIIKPDEIYNLAAQSHVGVSFYTPLYTANVNAIGVLAILDAIRNSKKNIRFYQAGTSKCSAKPKTSYKMKKQNLIHKALMVQQNFLHIILLKTIETHITFLHVMGFF